MQGESVVVAPEFVSRSAALPALPVLNGDRQRYYSAAFVQLEIVKLCKCKEMAWLQSKAKQDFPLKAFPIRCIKAWAIDFLQRNYEAFQFHQRNYDMFLSCASFSSLPMFSFAPPERREQQNAFFAVQFDSLWNGYDFFVDLDNKDIGVAHADAWLLKRVFDEFGLPYYVLFSGSQGFHFVVDYADFFPKGLGLNECVSLAGTICKNLKVVEGIGSIDLKISGDKARLRKVPYSLHGGFVCLPLSDAEFENFSLRSVSLHEVLHNVKIKNRGVLKRAGNPAGVKEFIKIFGGVF